MQVIILAENDLGRSSQVVLKNLIYSEKSLGKGIMIGSFFFKKKYTNFNFVIRIKIDNI